MATTSHLINILEVSSRKDHPFVHNFLTAFKQAISTNCIKFFFQGEGESQYESEIKRSREIIEVLIENAPGTKGNLCRLNVKAWEELVNTISENHPNVILNYQPPQFNSWSGIGTPPRAEESKEKITIPTLRPR